MAVQIRSRNETIKKEDANKVIEALDARIQANIRERDIFIMTVINNGDGSVSVSLYDHGRYFKEDVERSNIFIGPQIFQVGPHHFFYEDVDSPESYAKEIEALEAEVKKYMGPSLWIEDAEGQVIVEKDVENFINKKYIPKDDKEEVKGFYVCQWVVPIIPFDPDKVPILGQR